MALVASVFLLALPGMSVAAAAPESARGDASSHAGLIKLGAGYSKAGGTTQVRKLQRTLRGLGWRPGAVDGLYGARTATAVAGFQQAAGLAADGIVGPQTREALGAVADGSLRRGAGYAQFGGSPQVKTLQRTLRRRGLRPGPADGLFGPRTEAAVARLQRRGGVPASGVVTGGTRTLLAAADGAPEQSARPPAQSAPHPRQFVDGTALTAAAANDAGSSGLKISLLALVAVGAALVGALLGLLFRRRRPVVRGTAVPLEDGVIAEGEAHDRSIGHFRGEVKALVLGRRGWRRTPEARYLVSVHDRQGPVWLTQDEVSILVAPAANDPTEEEQAETTPDEDPQTPNAEPEKREATAVAAPAVVGGGHAVRVLGYVSIPRAGENEREALQKQTALIDALCQRKGWRLLEIVHDVEPVNGKNQRPGLAYAIERIAHGEATCLVVSQLNRLSRSVSDLARVLQWLAANGGRLVAMDVGLDTASSHGRVAANTLLSVGAWERQRLADRTRKGLEAARAKRAATGRPAVGDLPALKARIAAMRAEGMTLQAISDRLNADGVPTLRGGQKWRPSSVQAAAGYRRPPRDAARPKGGKRA